MKHYIQVPQPHTVTLDSSRIIIDNSIHSIHNVLNQSMTRSIHPYSTLHIQGGSMASSQKMSQRTQADLATEITSNSSRLLQSQRSQIIRPNNFVNNISLPSTASRAIIMHHNSHIEHVSIHNINHQKEIRLINAPNHGFRKILPIQQKSVQHYQFEQSTYNPPHISQTIPVIPSITYTKPAVSHNVIVHKNFNSEKSCHGHEYINQSFKTPRVTRLAQPLIADFTVENILLPPKMRVPRKRLDRLYKSAVEIRRYSQPTSYFLDRRPYSSENIMGKSMKRQVYIRGGHRSIISDKKIPVIGSYNCNDKSSDYFVRQTGSHLPKTTRSRVVQVKQEQMIPTQVIRVPIGRAEEQKASLVESAILSSDNDLNRLGMCESREFSSWNQIQQSSVRSLSNSRLSDHLKISVYKSPAVVIQQPQLITSGPKLTKQHVLRVATSGKLITQQKSTSLQRKKLNEQETSELPIAKHKTSTSKLDQVQTKCNPYLLSKVDDFISHTETQCQMTPTDNICVKSDSLITRTQFSNSQKSSEQAVGIDSRIKLIQSHVTSSFKNFESILSFDHYQNIKEVIETQIITKE